MVSETKEMTKRTVRLKADRQWRLDRVNHREIDKRGRWHKIQAMRRKSLQFGLLKWGISARIRCFWMNKVHGTHEWMNQIGSIFAWRLIRLAKRNDRYGSRKYKRMEQKREYELFPMEISQQKSENCIGSHSDLRRSCLRTAKPPIEFSLTYLHI